jgi:D-sedoheptulose 7-phosphate isomerase
MNNHSIERYIKNELKEIKLILETLEKNELKNFDKLVKESIKSINSGGKIILFGNGGSASDAQHLATELTVRYQKNRKALAAISLATDTSALTAIGNDFSFEEIFSRQIEAIGKKNDIILGISTSGNSKNVINALKIANRMKIKTFCFLGKKGGIAKKHSKYPIIFPNTSTSVTQVVQITYGQIFCEILESQLCR